MRKTYKNHKSIKYKSNKNSRALHKTIRRNKTRIHKNRKILFRIYFFLNQAKISKKCFGGKTVFNFLRKKYLKRKKNLADFYFNIKDYILLTIKNFFILVINCKFKLLAKIF